MRKSFKSLIVSVIALTALMPHHAHAQSIDYTSLQNMFGEPVTTGATGSPQRVSEAPVDMQILTADDIRRTGARNIAEALRGVSGVNVQQTGREDYDIGIRGYNQAYSHNILVLVNGRQVYLDDYGYTNWASIPVQMQEIKQIEIVKGPNTALFGFNAADGVINIVTYNPLYDTVATVGGAVGTGDYRDGHIVDTVKINDTVGIRLSAGATAAKDFSDVVNTQQPAGVFTDPSKDAVNLDTLIQLTPKSQLRFEASTSQAHESDMTAFNFQTNDRYDTNSVKTDYEADTSFGLIKATAYKNWLDTYFDGDIFNPGIAANVSNNVSVLQLADTFKIGVNNTFRLQAEYRHNVADGPVIGPTGSSLQENIKSVSAMWDWAINDQWSWTNSWRLDSLDLARSGPLDPDVALLQSDGDFDRNITRPSYNSGLVWKATPDDSFRLNTAHGLRMASLFDFGARITPVALINGVIPVTVAGNPLDNPTSVTSYEIGWDHKVKPLDGVFKADVFTEKTDDALPTGGNLAACPAFLVGLNPAFAGCTSTGNSIVVASTNIGDSSAIGSEVGLEGKIDKNWSWGINDTFERIFNHEQNQAYNTLEQTPVNLTNVHVGYQDGPWESDVYAYYNTPFHEPEPTGSFLLAPQAASMPSHISLSARVGYKLNDATTVAVSGQSLQQQNSLTSTGLETERQVFLSLEHAF